MEVVVALAEVEEGRGRRKAKVVVSTLLLKEHLMLRAGEEGSVCLLEMQVEGEGSGALMIVCLEKEASALSLRKQRARPPRTKTALRRGP